MKKIKRLIGVTTAFVMLLLSTFLFGACKDKIRYFGEFSCNGRRLIEQAEKKISAGDIKQLLQKSSRSGYAANYSTGGNGEAVSAFSNQTPDTVIDRIMRSFPVLKLNAKYFEGDSKKMTEKNDLIYGLNLEAYLRQNSYEPWGQIGMKYLVMYDELIDELENESAEYKKTNEARYAPDLYTYHKDKNDIAILQIHIVKQIPSAVYGGIGALFKQDIEIVYDHQGKITKWQTSLGTLVQTTLGTSNREGYIMEVDFEWNEEIPSLIS